MIPNTPDKTGLLHSGCSRINQIKQDGYIHSLLILKSWHIKIIY